MDVYDKISDMGKRRGIIFPSFEIYGGLGGFYDYGPIGTLLKHNIEEKWRNMFVRREGMVELESTIIMPEQVFQASGHLAHFTDLMTRCLSCDRAYRTDQLLSEAGVACSDAMKAEELDTLVSESSIKCPECGGALAKSEPFNLMFQVKIGSYGASLTGYGRPEAAQGQFVDFKRIYTSERERLPLGVAQIGRCVRNEIAPRKGPIRLREFTIVDYEIFVDPENTSYSRIKLVEGYKLRILLAAEQRAGSDKVSEMTVREALDGRVVLNEVLCYFMALAVKFLDDLGVPPEKQRLREVLSEERAHYSLQTFDQEVWLGRWGWTEISGHAYRTDYDLRNHMAHSGVDLRVYKAFETPKKVGKFSVKPEIVELEGDFGKEDAERIAELLAKSDGSIIERELREKGFYEMTGPYPARLTEKHVKITKSESEESGRNFVPHVIEPSFGIDRIIYAMLEYAYTEQKDRVILKIPREVAGKKAAVFPLVNKDGLPEVAKKIHDALIDEGLTVDFDGSRSIGRRYARADEVGVPICITVDYKTLEDGTVTLRDIYTWQQVRTRAIELPSLLRDYLRGKLEFEQLGEAVKSPSK